MKTKVLVGSLIFLIIVNLATLGTYLWLRFKAPHDMPMGTPPAAMMALDSATRERLHGIMMDFRRSMMPVQEELRRAEDSVIVLLQQDPVPTEQVDQLFIRISALRTSISQNAVRHLVQTKSFLTPEQQRHFFRAILDAQPRMRRGEGMGMGPRFGPDQRDGRPFERFAPMKHDSQP